MDEHVNANAGAAEGGSGAEAAGPAATGGGAGAPPGAPQDWAERRNEVEANLDLHEEALRAFLDLIAPWTDESLAEPLAADASWNNAKILGHVAYCIYYPYFGWMAEKLDLAPVASPLPADPSEGMARLRNIATIAGWREILEAAFPFVRGVASQMKDGDLGKDFPGPWGDRWTIEQMFEHATMHLHRHMRQIRRDRAAKGQMAG